MTRTTVKGPFQKDQNRPTNRSWSPGRGKMSPFLSPTAVPLPHRAPPSPHCKAGPVASPVAARWTRHLEPCPKPRSGGGIPVSPLWTAEVQSPPRYDEP
jgi:hypothetical protein